MNSAPDSSYRPSIDGLRAVAILLVVGFHVMPAAIPGGFLGVDVFFVISGYLITTLLRRDLEQSARPFWTTLVDFYGRRIRRILPALALVLFTCYALGYFYALPDQFKDDGLNIAASAGFCENLLASRQAGYFEAASLSRPLLHIWSLGVEEQFYLVWPLLLGALVGLRVRALPVIVFLAGCSYWLNFYPLGVQASTAFYLPQNRFWELAFGALAAFAAPGWQRHLTGAVAARLGNALSALGMLLIGVGTYLIHEQRTPLNAWMLLPVVGAFLVIVPGENTWANRTILARKPLIAIGLISYPLYLWHWPLLIYARTSLPEGGRLPAQLGAAGVACLLAWATYRFVEIPIRHGAHRRIKTLVALGATALAGLAGFHAYRHDGLPSRLPPVILELLDYAQNPYRGSRPVCLLTQEDDPHGFPAPEINPAKPTLLLWGDSFADHLAPGLRKRFSATHNLVQRTMMQTPPLVGRDFAGRPNAARMNDVVLQLAREIRPACVVLAGSWIHYDDWASVERTVRELRAIGPVRIVLVGPVPEWEGSLPKQLLNWHRQHPGQPLPQRMRLGAKPAPGALDPQMARFAAQLGIDYFSPYQVLAGQDGYLVRFGDDIASLVSYDSGHLTAAASEYVITRFPDITR